MDTVKKTNKIKLFLENFLIYGLGGIVSRIVPIIMLPIITRLLPDTSYYGLSDLSTTAISFASAFAVLGMYDAMYRLFFEKEDEMYKVQVCSTAFQFTIVSSIVITLVMIICKDFIAAFFFKDKKYSYLVYITAMATLVTATNNIVAAPTRMQNKRKTYLIAHTIGPILSYAIAIPLVLNECYIIALPLASLISAATIEISFYILNKRWFSIGLFDKKILKQLLTIGIPLLPNFLIYWVFNSSDKIMITSFINVGASGVYGVGAKLGHVSQLIYTAFAGGWQFFAFSTMKDKNQVESNSRIFEYLGIISFVASSFVFALSRPIFKIFFTIDYYEGYIVAPYLFLAPLMQMLFQVIASQFLVIKKTWPNMLILSSGAIINVILNLTLIPRIGIEGAAIATLIGYVCSDFICCLVLCKMKLMTISRKFCIAAALMGGFIILWRCILIENTIMSVITAFVFLGFSIYIYKTEIRYLIRTVKTGLKKK